MSESRAGPSDASFGFEDDSWLGRLRSASFMPAEEPLGRLGAYELLAKIGQGGQATVFKAKQPGTGRFVAIKRVRLGGLDDRALVRFQREIEVAATLRHPGIVTVHELIDHDRGLVMEWIDGQSLDRWADAIRSSTDGLRRIVACTRAACQAVAHAHGQGVIHRDLKPSNILVDASGTPKVVDFGLARDATKHDITLTVQGAFAGTPVYASPEQTNQGLHAADVRGDVYSMGAVLHRVLTGKEPFEAPTLAALFDQIRGGHVESVSSLNPGVDRELESIVRMAMHRDRATRYATMADLADDLGRWMDRKAVRAHPPSGLYHARAFVRRHRVGVTLASLGLVLIIGAGVAAGLLAWRLNQQRVELTKTVGERDVALADATKQRDLAQSEALASASANQFLGGLMVSIGESSPDLRATILAVLQAKAAEFDRRKSALRPEIDARLRVNLARTLRTLGDHSLAQDQARKVIAIADQFGVAKGDRDQAAGLITAIHMDQGRYAEALEDLESDRIQPDALGQFQPHFLVTSDDSYLEALVKVGHPEKAQRYLDSMLPPKGTSLALAWQIASPFRTLCETHGLRPPSWMTTPPPIPANSGPPPGTPPVKR